MSLVRYLMLQLFWCDNWLKIKGKICNRFQLIEDFECSWHFENLAPGNYQVRLLYSNPEGEFLFNDSQTRQTYLIKNYEAIMVSSPWLNFEIVEPREPTERKSKQIIVDGVCFQTIVEEKIFSFPRNEGDFSRKVKMGIEITNNSLFPWRFCSFDTMIPELIGEEGLILRQACGGSQGWKTPQEADFELVRPAESITFLGKTQLKRERDGLLTLTVAGGGQACWKFENLKFGKYQIQFTYRSLTELGGGVKSFNITGIDSIFGPTQETAFPIQLAFNKNTGSFKMEPISQPKSVPEPHSLFGLFTLLLWADFPSLKIPKSK